MIEKTGQLKIKLNDISNKKLLKNQAKVKSSSPNTVTSNRLKLMITVVNRHKTDFYTDLIQSFDVNMQVITLAQGTADARTLQLMGLADSDKSVIFSVIQENKLQDALDTLNNKFKTVKDGNGIAFTVPLTSIIGTRLFGFLSNNKSIVKEDK